MTVPFFVRDKQPINRILNIMKMFGTFSSVNARLKNVGFVGLASLGFERIGQ